FVVAAEAFADRRYEPDGSLTPRSLPGALVEEPETAARQAVSIAVEGTVLSRGGLHVAVPAETICLHGDTPGALEIARRVATRLREAGVTLARLAPR
ncbi:LamB/YcsF family protein, partial [Acidobacteria bacterium ACD]|nr:LamB/YcsF family protein [Acidobacteria bacterium ACD]